MSRRASPEIAVRRAAVDAFADVAGILWDREKCYINRGIARSTLSNLMLTIAARSPDHKSGPSMN
jgi:hypothetical protein